MKKCRKCDELKDVSAFSKDKRNKDGLQSYCKVCCSKSIKKWKEENKEKWKNCAKKWREENKDYDKKWREENREKRNKTQRDYRARAKPCVYRIKHKQNGSYYLGQTTRPLCERVASHFSPTGCFSSPFTGLNREDWIVETLCYGTKEQVRHLEKVLLDKRIDIDPNCLNKQKW